MESEATEIRRCKALPDDRSNDSGLERLADEPGREQRDGGSRDGGHTEHARTVDDRSQEHSEPCTGTPASDRSTRYEPHDETSNQEKREISQWNTKEQLFWREEEGTGFEEDPSKHACIQEYIDSESSDPPDKPHEK